MISFVFPGQGSQTVGMLDAWQGVDAVQQAIGRASDALGQDLQALIAHGPQDTLNLTTNTQPAMLAASVAMWQAWRAAGGAMPAMVAGHSLGEYSALVAAGALTLEDAVRVVRVRADAMQQAVPLGQGAMAAVLGLVDEAVIAACNQATGADEIVEAVNFNAPAQVVIAGHRAAVERACELAKAAGAKRAMLLPVSAPFHSRLLEPAAQVLGQALDAIPIHAPAFPVVNNVDVACVTEPAQIRDALVRQAWHPVRWVETIRFMKAAGVTHVVECGPGKVLAGLIKRIDKDMQVLSVFDPTSMQAALETLEALAAVAAPGQQASN